MDLKKLTNLRRFVLNRIGNNAVYLTVFKTNMCKYPREKINANYYQDLNLFPCIKTFPINL